MISKGVYASLSDAPHALNLLELTQMTDQTPQSTGLAGLVAEAKDVETKLEALFVHPPASVPAAPSAISSSPPPAETALSPLPITGTPPLPQAPNAPPAPVVVAPPASTDPISSPALNDAVTKENARIADLEAQKQAFYDRIRAAHAAGLPVAPTVQPMPERIRLQTEAEMAAGAAAVAKHAEAQGQRIIVAPSPVIEGNMTPVFRPADYVPNQKKGQGNVTATNLT